MAKKKGSKCKDGVMRMAFGGMIPGAGRGLRNWGGGAPSAGHAMNQVYSNPTIPSPMLTGRPAMPAPMPTQNLTGGFPFSGGLAGLLPAGQKSGLGSSIDPKLMLGIPQGPGTLRGFAKGGKVPGRGKVAEDSHDNDVVPALLSPGEIVVPKSHAKSQKKAKAFVSKILKPKKVKRAK